ncbi:pyroglutamyl-peptidase I [Paenibacillus lemnae]|uniref:Pyroglutamyl-peptidase I n=1 Tax=Paenibacillus lemnae TaxID=1330551 RepID=A0A848MCN9_PAELE|nr:pyroglutamyl-peptidase I [Paenibacillus lemnae]NMO97833.1 pyroglutamyl-peptidase I [Paenibacillus lemnae]
MKLLVSGFEPFGGSLINPTEGLIRDLQKMAFANAEIRIILLPVHFDECADLLLSEIRTWQPDAVIACGVAAGRTAITPERIAVNLKDIAADAPYPDNRGARPQDEPIDPEGPDGLFTKLPVRRMVQQMKEAGIPAAISYSAGTFICNNTMYAVLNDIRQYDRKILGGFVHFPASTDMAADKPGMPSLSHETMLKGLEIIIQTTIDEIENQQKKEDKVSN